MLYGLTLPATIPQHLVYTRCYLFHLSELRRLIQPGYSKYVVEILEEASDMEGAVA